MNDRFKFRAYDTLKKQYRYDVQDMYDNEVECFGYMLDDTYKDRYIVEQCTGLKDKNGKLIYEGDILKVKVFDKKNYNQKKTTYWTVEWQEHRNNHGFMVYGINRRWNAPITLNRLFNSEAIIVGNIHENPELLEDDNAR